jgi:hypothetical protein
MRSQWSSVGYSVAAYQPYYAPPTVPTTQYIQTGMSHWVNNIPAMEGITNGAATVVRKPRSLGIRYLYARGAHTLRWFRMQATGQVESTKFNPVSAWTWDGCFNDAIYQAGYPRNTGLTIKVAQIPAAALGIQQSQMLPRPRFTKSVFTNRSFATVKGLPAQGIIPPPTQGAHS